MSSSNIQISLLQLDNSIAFSIAIPKTKLLSFSDHAERENNSGRLLHDRMVFQVPEAEMEGLKLVLHWIQGNNADKPAPLTTQGLGIDTFDACVYVQRATNRLNIRRELRGDDVREVIFAYLKQGCLRFDEFAMVVEVLGYDLGIVNSAKHQVMLGCILGGAARPPEMHLIEAYARANGLWREMEMVTRQIVWYRAQAAHRAGREQAGGHAHAAAVPAPSKQSQ